MAGPLRIASLGDSVPWGQGLAEQDKYNRLVTAALTANHPGTALVSRAHSGAVIGALPVTGNAEPGEVPAPAPTILQQCDQFDAQPDQIDIVLLDGGINDVDIRIILNPVIPLPLLSARIDEVCHFDMLTLLQHVTKVFSKPAAAILVTGYYPILSSQSRPPLIPPFLGLHGVRPPLFGAIDSILTEPVVKRCALFYTESTAALKAAVAECGDHRVGYVDPQFGDENAVFAPNAWLWGLNPDVDASPQDEVIAERHAACNAVYSELQLVERETCYRASAGHPNRAGAQQFARRILAELGARGIT